MKFVLLYESATDVMSKAPHFFPGTDWTAPTYRTRAQELASVGFATIATTSAGVAWANGYRDQRTR
jgi:2-methylisocitrate lyase-like PEP mutase family enzyme